MVKNKAQFGLFLYYCTTTTICLLFRLLLNPWSSVQVVRKTPLLSQNSIFSPSPNGKFYSQEKLEERILQVERLEQEICELKRTNSNLNAEKLSVDKILEMTMEDKKQMCDRINELKIIGKSLRT